MTPVKCTVDARKFFALAPFVSSEEARYYLNGVCIQPNPDGDGNILIATDGHTIGVFLDKTGHWPASVRTSHVDGIIVKLDKDLASATKRLLKACERITNHGSARLVIELDSDGDMLVTLQQALIENRYEAVMTKYKLRIDGTFPDWRRVLPAGDRETGANPAMNVASIRKFEAIAKAKFPHSIQFNAGKTDDDPVRVYTGDPDFIGVITPMKYSTSDWNWE